MRALPLLLLLLTGCPAEKVQPPKATCQKVGDSCEFAPGKLGLCVEPVNGGTLLCQSQH